MTKPDCPICDGQGWLCEPHELPSKPYSKRFDACDCGGPDKPCACNTGSPPKPAPGRRTIYDRDEWRH